MSETLIHNQLPTTTLLLPEGRTDIPATLLHGQKAELDTNVSLYHPNEIGIEEFTNQGFRRSVVGEVVLNGANGPEAEMVIIKIGKSDTVPDRYYLAGLEKDRQGNSRVRGDANWVPLLDNRPVVLGRSSEVTGGERLIGKGFADGISRKHAAVTLLDDKIAIEDMSSNGSSFRGVEAQEVIQEDTYDYTSSHTQTAEDLARLRGMLKEQGGVAQFEGRPTIGRDTFPIDGGVDIRSWVAGGEAIVVDSKRYPKEFAELFTRFSEELKRVASDGKFRGKSRDEQVLQAIYRTVDASLKYDSQYVEQEIKFVTKNNPTHRKTALNNYLIDGKGVCRHMALTASWLGGEAVSRGLLKGRFTTEVNQSTKGVGAHEWVRFVPEDGDTYIIDVAQHYMGKLEDTVSMPGQPEDRWGYFRSQEERDIYRKKRVGRSATSIAGYPIIPNPGRIITSSDIPR